MKMYICKSVLSHLYLRINKHVTFMVQYISHLSSIPYIAAIYK